MRRTFEFLFMRIHCFTYTLSCGDPFNLSSGDSHIDAGTDTQHRYHHMYNVTMRNQCLGTSETMSILTSSIGGIFVDKACDGACVTISSVVEFSMIRLPYLPVATLSLKCGWYMSSPHTTFSLLASAEHGFIANPSVVYPTHCVCCQACQHLLFLTLST